MRSFLNSYLEIVHAGLSHPSELADVLKRSGGLQYLYNAGVLFISVSVATGLYLLRDFHHSLYWAELALLSLFLFIFMNLWSLISGAVTDRIVHIYHAERSPQAETASYGSAFVLIPFIFFSPGAGLIKNAEHQGIFLLLLFLFLSGWSIYSGLRFIQSLYDLSFRDSVKVLLISQLIMFIFPFLLIIFIVIFTVSLV